VHKYAHKALLFYTFMTAAFLKCVYKQYISPRFTVVKAQHYTVKQKENNSFTFDSHSDGY